MSKVHPNQLSLFTDDELDATNRPPYIPDKGDEKHFVGECDKIYQDNITILNTFGYTENDIIPLAKKYKFPKYMISLFQTKDDKTLFEKDYESYKYIHDTLDDKWSRRELRMKARDEYKFYRTVVQTALDIGIDAIVTHIMQELILKHSKYKIRMNDVDDNFELISEATKVPDFKFGNGGFLEMKKSSAKKWGFNNTNTQFQINPKMIWSELTPYKKYNYMFFLRIDVNTNKMVVIYIDEFDTNGCAHFSKSRVTKYTNQNDFTTALDNAIKDAIKVYKTYYGNSKSN